MGEKRINALRTSQSSLFGELSGSQFAFFIAALISLVLAAVLCASGKYREAAVASAVVLSIAFILSARISIESLLITWFVTTPIAYFYIRFPVDKSVITYDRAVFALVVMMLLWGRRRASGIEGKRAGQNRPEISDAKTQKLHFSASGAQLSGARLSAAALSASRFEILWALLSVLALASAVMRSNDVAYAVRIAVDSFFLPLTAFHLARHHFDGRGRAVPLMLAAMALGLILLATGAFEFVTGTNLFPYKGSELIRERELRVNGPFAADTSYTIICLLVAIFLQAAPEFLRVRFDRVARLLYLLALGAAAVATLLPLFRATAIALVVCWIILRGATAGRTLWLRGRGDSHAAGSSRRGLWMLTLIATSIVVLIFGPFSIGRRITDPRNAFGRLATWEAAAAIAVERPLFGVGLTNYRDYFHAKYNWEDESVETVLSARAADSPHSNLLWIAADLGLAALALYLMANLYLLFMGWRAMKEADGAQQRAAAACYLALVAAYWIPGLTLASGYYSDLNLYFFFILGLLLNKSLVTQPASIKGSIRQSEF